MRSWLTTIALLLVVAALGTWIYVRPIETQNGESHALSALTPAEVKRVRLERPAAADGTTAATAVALEREDGVWRMTAPVKARAEAFQVERLLSILEARSAMRLPASDLARFGLDRPQAILTLEDQAFAYGAVNPTTREQYVMTRDEVYAVPLTSANALPRNADALLAKQLFAPGEAPVRFDLPGFTVAMQDGVWAIAPAVDADVGADERNAWVEAWRQAAAISAARYSGAPAQEEIRIELKDGRTVVLGIVHRSPDLVLVRRDEDIEYHFFGDAGRRLLAPPGAKK